MTSIRRGDGIVTGDPDAGVCVAARGDALAVAVADSESTAVRRAVANLAGDLERVVGATVTVDGDASSARIVVGTIGVSPAVDAAIAAGRLDVSALTGEDDALRWEGFVIALVDDVLHLVGTDRRGTVYAVYEFARAFGVSPWQWWADAPIHPRDHITVPRGAQVCDWPSVRYRGVFINDEEELYHWARRHTQDDTIGPETYERLFELLLRLGANYLWPAMHVGAFNCDPQNGSLAHEMGVVIGSSHCDILLRSNNHEFQPWTDARDEPIRYDYSLRGANRDGLRDYWRGSVEQNSGYEVTWTLGVRGVHDSGFETRAIDDDDTLDEEGKFRARVSLLEEAINDQREILSDTLGVAHDTPPQLFIPYKEVLPLYDAGLAVPDDVTLVWANDNFGYIRRFPSEKEQQRSGGHGLYYHSSYWSNYTTSYLATSSTPLALMRSELSKAWASGIRRLWVDNVGGLKPLEIETEFFLRSAWEAGRESSTGDVRDFVAQWVDATFSGSLGARAAHVYARYYQLNNQRKYEHLTSDVFSQTGYGDEAGRRLADLRTLFDETNVLMAELPEAERDAFFQLFAIKVHMSYLVNGEFVYADRSTLAHGQGKLAAADAYVATARRFGDLRRQLIHFYNRVMSDGRWDGMFTPEAFPPPVMPLHAPGTPAVDIGVGGIGVTVWGDSTAATRTLTFAPFGRREKWIEVFAAGAAPTRFTLECDSWIELSTREGVVEAEQRIAVRLCEPPADLAGRAGSIRVTAPDTGEVVEIEVLVGADPGLEADFSGWVEADGVVSIDPSAPDAVVSGDSQVWALAPDLGRYGSTALQVQPVETRRDDSEHAAIATYRVHLSTAGSHLLELHRLPTLDSTGRIRVGLGIDNGGPLVVESASTDEHRGSWASGIQNNIEKLRVTLPPLVAGAHTLSLHGLDPWFTLSKIVVYTAQASDTSLGPEFSAHSQWGAQFTADPDPSAIDLRELEGELERLYRSTADDVAVPDQLYARHDFWRSETTNRKPIAIPQPPRRIGQWDPASSVKDLRSGVGLGPLAASDGVIAFEAEDALAADTHAWATPAVGDGASWVQTQAESAARSGLAMQARPRGLQWHDPLEAPAMHYAIRVSVGGTYRVWLLLAFEDDRDDSCVIALDGVPQPIGAQFACGEMCAYGTRQAWVWAHLSDLEISEGHHTFSIHARKSGLRIDRVYLTLGDELPPIDARWTPTPRITAAVDSEALATAPRA